MDGAQVLSAREPVRVRIRAGQGLGDSLYLQAIARHLAERGMRIEALTHWHDVFDEARRFGVTTSRFSRDNVDLIAHYTLRKDIPGTDQFLDMCLQAGITEPVDLRLDWKRRSTTLVRKVEAAAAGRPLVLVQLPREPFDRRDGYGRELLPDCGKIQKVIDYLAPSVFLVQIGKRPSLHEFCGIELDLVDRTSVADVLDLTAMARGLLGYCSFFVPLAECFSKPALFVWSRAGTRSRKEYLQTITPQKILHKKDLCRAIFDDCADADLYKAADAFLDQVRNQAIL